MFTLFDDMLLSSEARRAVDASMAYAQLRGGGQIRTEHLLMTILQPVFQLESAQDLGVPTAVITKLVYRLPGFIPMLEKLWTPADKQAQQPHPAMLFWSEVVYSSPTLNEAMRFAHREALETIAPNQDIVIDETHVLLGIAMEQNGLGGEVLRRFGDIVTLRKMVVALREEVQVAA